MDKITDSMKENPIMWGVGGVVAVVAVVWAVEYRKKKAEEQQRAAMVAAAKRAAAAVKAAAAQVPRGRLPWAIGDIDMWGPDMKKTL